MRKKSAMVKKDFPKQPEFVDSVARLLVQKFVPIVAAAGLVTRFANE